MATDRTINKSKIEPDHGQMADADQSAHNARSCSQLLRKEVTRELGTGSGSECTVPDTAHTNTHDATTVTFSEDIARAEAPPPVFPEKVRRKGGRPFVERDVDGNEIVDNAGNKSLIANVIGTHLHERRSRTRLVDKLERRLPEKHARVLDALVWSLQPLKRGQIKPLATARAGSDDIVVDQTHGKLLPHQCLNEWPTHFAVVRNLTWHKFDPVLNYSDDEVFFMQLEQTSKHLGDAFDLKRTQKLAPRPSRITKAEFEHILDDLHAVGMLVVGEDTHGDRAALMNVLQLAQCLPQQAQTISLALGPNGTAETDFAHPKTVTASGDARAPKKREQSKEHYKALAGKRGRWIEVQEEVHANEKANLRGQISTLRAELTDVQGQLQRMADHIGEVLADPRNSDADVRHAMETMFTAPDKDTDSSSHRQKQTKKENIR